MEKTTIEGAAVEQQAGAGDEKTQDAVAVEPPTGEQQAVAAEHQEEDTKSAASAKRAGAAGTRALRHAIAASGPLGQVIEKPQTFLCQEEMEEIVANMSECATLDDLDALKDKFEKSKACSRELKEACLERKTNWSGTFSGAKDDVSRIAEHQ